LNHIIGELEHTLCSIFVGGCSKHSGELKEILRSIFVGVPSATFSCGQSTLLRRALAQRGVEIADDGVHFTKKLRRP